MAARRAFRLLGPVAGVVGSVGRGLLPRRPDAARWRLSAGVESRQLPWSGGVRHRTGAAALRACSEPCDARAGGAERLPHLEPRAPGADADRLWLAGRAVP